MPTRADPRPPVPTSGQVPAGVAAGPSSPAAARLARPRWLDPRLLVGLVLVLGSMIVGARVVAGADDSVGVWATTTDLAAGSTVTAADVVVRAVRLDSGSERYLSADRPLPAGLVLSRPVGAGELLPAAAVTPARDAGLRYVTVAIPRTELPAGTSKGSRVDVWLAPSSLDRGGDTTSGAPSAGAAAAGAPTVGARQPAARLILAGATVEGADLDEGGFGGGDGVVPVVLAVGGSDSAAVVADILTASRAGRLYLVGAPGS